jgi:magnesium transporter
MSTEEKVSIQNEFEEMLETQDEKRIQEFLDEQNISDVAELIYDNEELEDYISWMLLTIFA